MSENSNYWQQVMRRRMARRTLLGTGALVGVGLVAGGGAFGCAGGQPKAGSTATPSASDQPQTGGVLKWDTGGDPPSWDLISNSTYMALNPAAPCYNGLVMYDPMDPTKVIGDLAEKWNMSSDGKTYTFTMVKNAKFHDGTPCTSKDVKASIDIVANPPKGVVSPRKANLASIDGIETPDDYTVRIVLKRPAPSLINNLAPGWMVVYPKKILDANGPLTKEPIGTGPFKLKEYVRGVSIELVRNPDYHVKGRPYLDGIKFFIIPDTSTGFANFRTGQLHFFRSINGDQARQAEKEFGDKVVCPSAPSTTTDYLAFNTKRKPWDDIRVRQAVSLCIDRAEACKIVRLGDADISGMMPPKGPWALPASELEKIPGFGKDKAADIAQAKKLMAEAGYASGLSTTLLTRKGAEFEPLSIFFKDQMAKIGIDAKLDVQESAAAYDMLNKRAFDLGPWVATVANDDPDAIFGEFYICAGERNYTQFCNPEVEALFEKQSQTVNVEERKKLVNQMEKMAMMDFNFILMEFRRRFLGISRLVHDYKLHPGPYNNQRLQDVWLSKS